MAPCTSTINKLMSKMFSSCVRLSSRITRRHARSGVVFVGEILGVPLKIGAAKNLYLPIFRPGTHGNENDRGDPPIYRQTFHF